MRQKLDLIPESTTNSLYDCVSYICWNFKLSKSCSIVTITNKSFIEPFLLWDTLTLYLFSSLYVKASLNLPSLNNTPMNQAFISCKMNRWSNIPPFNGYIFVSGAFSCLELHRHQAGFRFNWSHRKGLEYWSAQPCISCLSYQFFQSFLLSSNMIHWYWCYYLLHIVWLLCWGQFWQYLEFDLITSNLVQWVLKRENVIGREKWRI